MKCLHSETKHRNESINSMIWKRVSRSTYCTKNKLEAAVKSDPYLFADYVSLSSVMKCQLTGYAEGNRPPSEPIFDLNPSEGK